jgi:hypothetical protein
METAIFVGEVAVATISSVDSERYQVYVPDPGLTINLGKRELAAAKAFDGVRDHSEIESHLRDEHGIAINRAALQRFETKMLQWHPASKGR